MGNIVLTGGVYWQKEGDVSSLPLLHPTCCELTQPGHTGPSRTAVTGELTTSTQACSSERSLLYVKLAVLSQLNLNKYTLLIPVANLSICCLLSRSDHMAGCRSVLLESVGFREVVKISAVCSVHSILVRVSE